MKIFLVLGSQYEYNDLLTSLGVGTRLFSYFELRDKPQGMFRQMAETGLPPRPKRRRKKLAPETEEVAVPKLVAKKQLKKEETDLEDFKARMRRKHGNG